MSYYRVKIRKTDRMWSRYIRDKAGGKCEYCGKVCEVNGEVIKKLECSHYFGRKNESVRFDPENTYALCFTCHKELGGHTRLENGEYDQWVRKRLGDKRYKLLKIRANSYKKRDDKLDEIIIKNISK